MVTAMDLITSDSVLQEHWLKRVVALIIDSIIVSIIAVPLVFFGALGFGFIASFISFAIYFLYSALLEAAMGATLGKKIMGLKVVSLAGPLGFEKAFIRNISKVWGLLLFIDWLIGFATEGDPKQRYMDRVAGTTVVLASSTAPQGVYQQGYQQPPPPQANYQHNQPPVHQAPPPPYQENEAPPPPDQICESCGGRLVPTGSGRLQCIRCGKIL